MVEKELIPTSSILHTSQHPSARKLWVVIPAVLLGAALWLLASPHESESVRVVEFYHHVSTTDLVCPGFETHSGHIGLKGDGEETPKRSFFWYFPAENDSKNAPVILSFGGGPGTSGLMNAVFGQSACILTKDGLVRNPNRWTEYYNLVVLDHPIGAGFSYGTMVNNSRDAALDVYDFLQKFFVLYPELGNNRFYVAGGSYGGVYVPNVATVIEEQNALSSPSAIHINLEAVMVSNPMSDSASHYGWYLYYRCHLHNIYNATTCEELYPVVPQCLEMIELSYLTGTVADKRDALKYCSQLEGYDTHGRVTEDIRRVCLKKPTEDEPVPCHPEFKWALDTFDNTTIRAQLGIPETVNFTSLNADLNHLFWQTADRAGKHYLMYEPLLKSGVRVLHWIGAQDANCAWPGVLHFLKLIETPFQPAFLSTPDVRWGNGEMTVRSVGEGAGNMTFLLIDGAGHFAVKDQPKLAKYIMETWIENRPWFEDLAVDVN